MEKINKRRCYEKTHVQTRKTKTNNNQHEQTQTNQQHGPHVNPVIFSDIEYIELIINGKKNSFEGNISLQTRYVLEQIG